MADKLSTGLEAAVRRRQLVQFWRPFEGDSVNGYVLALGPRWLLLSLVCGDVRFNGFQCFRLRDVRKLQIPHPHGEFIEAALRKRGERVPKKPRVSVASPKELLRSANRLFPLVTIHREQVDPDVCWIGRVCDVDEKRVALLEIDPNARWDDKPTDYRLREITRVDFGGDYEDALSVVGGSPPRL